MDLVVKRSTPAAAGRLADLHIRLVGGSLLRRTVVSVAAFTMSTCLLLGLISMAAVEATRAIAGGGDAPGASAAIADAASDDEASEEGASSSSKSTPTSPRASRGAKGSRAARRPGGAVAPADALRTAGEGDGS